MAHRPAERLGSNEKKGVFRRGDVDDSSILGRGLRVIEFTSNKRSGIVKSVDTKFELFYFDRGPDI